MKQIKEKKRGFTLIELLVGIAIISLVASIIFARLSSAQERSRNSKRRSDMVQVRSALELYHTDNRAYPSTSGAWWGTCSTYGSRARSGSNGWVPNLAPNYIVLLPVETRPIGTNGCYVYRSDGTNYKMLVHLTYEGNCSPTVPANDGMYDPIRSNGQCTVGVYSSGAQAW